MNYFADLDLQSIYLHLIHFESIFSRKQMTFKSFFFAAKIFSLPVVVFLFLVDFNVEAAIGDHENGKNRVSFFVVVFICRLIYLYID